MQRFLCWDKENILENSNAIILQHKLEKKNLALVNSEDWEGVHNGYATVIKVGDTYRMYYRICGQNGFVYPAKDRPNKNMVGVAESKDGITFTKPILNKIEYNGSKENNVVFYRDNGGNLDTFTVFYDPNPDCPKDEKFKALARDSGTDILDYYKSTDGYDFQYVANIRTNGTYDTYNVVYWDEDKKQYVMYYRGYRKKDGTILNGYSGMDETNDFRDVRIATSRDFVKWEFVDFIKIQNSKEVQLYTNQITPYYREKNTLIGFPTRYFDRVEEKENFKDMPIWEARSKIEGRGATAITDCGIMTSTDGLNFNLRKSAFLTPGIENSANWWYGGCYMAYGMVETLAEDGENTEISMYVGENYRVKKVDFRRLTIRLDGFFSWYGDGDGATVTTKPFVLKHQNMLANFATSALGGIKFTILDKDGDEIEGYKSITLFGDSTNRPVRFEKTLKDLIGKEIKLKIELNDCNLYSYTFE